MKKLSSASRLALILLLLLTACQGQIPGGPATQPGGTNSVSTLAAPNPKTPAPTSDSPPSSSKVLTLWLPPTLDPDAAAPAAQLLKERLAEFSTQTGIQLEVRIKAVDGNGGLLDSLSSASAAAPEALPDLVALPYPVFEAAAIKGLLHPFDGMTTALESSDWYDFALQLGHLQQSTYGLPFAGDALVLVYNPNQITNPPRDLQAALQEQGPLFFPAGDSQALFTLALYLSSGGSLQDGQGRPILDVDILTQVLAYFQKARQSGLMPSWLYQFETDDQSWTAYQQGRATMVITWASRLLSPTTEIPPGSQASPLPTLQGVPYTLATGWVLALAGSSLDRQAEAVQLAEFLTNSDFLAHYTQTAGYLPPRSSALSAWSDTPMKSLTSQIALSAHLIPSADLLSSIAPLLRRATVQVLNNQGDPQNLAREAANALK